MKRLLVTVTQSCLSVRNTEFFEGLQYFIGYFYQNLELRHLNSVRTSDSAHCLKRPKYSRTKSSGRLVTEVIFEYAYFKDMSVAKKEDRKSDHFIEGLPRV